jgi:hypothetical protein
MRATNVTPVLLRARDAGLTVRVDGDALEVGPRSRLTPEIEAELLANKAALIEALAWTEEAADALLADATAYLNEFYVKADKPDLALTDLDELEARVDVAYAEDDMFALRIAVRAWVRAGVDLFGMQQAKKGAA